MANVNMSPTSPSGPPLDPLWTAVHPSKGPEAAPARRQFFALSGCPPRHALYPCRFISVVAAPLTMQIA
jgi:hypothetical protein